MGLTPVQIADIEAARKRIQFFGTPEKGYTDSGLWEFLEYVYTKDQHDHENPVKPLIHKEDIYIIVVYLFLLACPVIDIPKSRQVRMSWIVCAFFCWFVRTAPYRQCVYQTKKEDDAHEQTTMGHKSPGDGRMDFIEQHLPAWLQDEHFVSGKGNQMGAMTYSPRPDSYGEIECPWYGSKVNAIPQGGDQVRHYTATLGASDEAAFQSEYAPSMRAALPTINGGGRWISVSSVEAGSAFNSAVLECADGRDPSKDRTCWADVPDAVQKGLDLLGLEWPRGMRSRLTPSGIWVLEVHHTADPHKDPQRDGVAWVEESSKGYFGGVKGMAWRAEMGGDETLDYGAGGGEAVFPFLHHDSPIIVPEIPVDEALGRFRFYAGYDYGTTNPSHFGVWGIDTSGHAYKVWELHEKCVNLHDHVAKMKRCPYWSRIEYKVCDWSMMNKSQRNRDGDLVTIHEQYEELGVSFMRGLKGGDMAHVLMLKRSFWADPSNPTMFITRACQDTIREYMGLRFDEHASDAVELRQNKKEKIRNKDNHSFDADVMLFDTRPSGFVAKERVIDWSEPETTMDAVSKRMDDAEYMKNRRGSQVAW